MAGLPIRLIRRDGKLIELECTNYSMTVKRAIKPRPIPLSGERLGFDLNMVESAIRMECILSDDDCLDSEFVAGKADGYIDFSAYLQAAESIAAGADVVRYMSGDEGPYTRTNLDDMVISINAVPNTGTVADVINITLDSSATSHGHTSSGTSPTTHSLTVGLNQNTDSGINGAHTGEFMAQIIKEAISDYAALTALITPTVSSGFMDMADEYSRLDLKMVNNGSVADYSEMTITSPGDVDLPLFQAIIDSDTNSCFSAGDKMQNLISVAINNSVVGAVGSLGKGDIVSVDWGFTDSKTGYDDYIVGLQIPYNSFNGISDIYGTTQETTPQSYSARNFFFGTGIGNRQKDANANTLGASVDFDVKNKNTGIRGTIMAVDFDYQAGETVYGATLTFQPLDLWGAL